MSENVCPPEHAHGVNFNCYSNHRCRCADCRAYSTEQARLRHKLKAYGQWTERHVPSTGTRRRLQALIAIGWSQEKLAAEMGLTGASNLRRFLSSSRTQVRATTHDRVAALYDRLWDIAPEHGSWRSLSAFNRSRNYARAHRFLPPLAWDDIDTDVEPPAVDRDPTFIDDTAVELAMTGAQVHLTTLERIEAVRRLNARCLSDTEIAALLHINDRSVLRIRGGHQIPAAMLQDHQPIHGRGVAA
jgi:transcriptional regulator with XRE-family HTH domain